MSIVSYRTLADGVVAIAVGMLAGAALSQPPGGGAPQPRPDATLAAAPAGFDVRREGVPAWGHDRPCQNSRARELALRFVSALIARQRA